MKDLRIAVIAPVWLPVPPLGYGGIERVVSLLVDELVARGHEVTLFAAGGSHSNARVVSVLEAPPLIGDPAAMADELFHTLSAYLHADEFDVIHDHSGIGPALGAMLGGRPPVVHTLHGPWTPLGRRFAGLVHDRVHLVAISRAQVRANDAVRYAAVVHNGVDLAQYPFCPDKDHYLAYVGRASPEKGTHLAVEVARAVDMPLKMAVKRMEEPEWEYWEKMVVPLLRGDEEIHEQPPHEVKWEIMAHATATLFPIDWPEPFGLVMAESMACGTPVIARPLGSVPEVVVDGTTGFWCDTVEDMAAATLWARSLDPWASRRWVEERFSVTAMVSGYESLYRRLARSWDPGRASRPGDLELQRR